MHSDALETTDAYSASKATAPRVSLEDMHSRIVGEFYSRGDVAVFGTNVAFPTGSHATRVVESLGLLTICILVLDNGFTVVGKSAPASAANFDEEKGRTFAYEDAIKQLWPLMGFALKEHQHWGGSTAWAQPMPDQATLLHTMSEGHFGGSIGNGIYKGEEPTGIAVGAYAGTITLPPGAKPEDFTVFNAADEADDEPELTEDFFDRAAIHDGRALVRPADGTLTQGGSIGNDPGFSASATTLNASETGYTQTTTSKGDGQ